MNSGKIDQDRRILMVLFVVMGIAIQAIAIDMWVSEVSCYASTKLSRGGCLFGESAKKAGIFVAWLGVVFFLPLVRNKTVVKASLSVWFLGVCIFVFRIVMGD